MLKSLLKAACAMLLLATASPALAGEDGVAAFYSGKTIRVVNAFGQGGQYSVLARLIAMHLPRHIPGKPTGVPQFMPGAGGLLQANYLYNAAPKDGTVIGLMYDNAPASQVLESPDTVKYDARGFHAIGTLNKGESGLLGVLKRTGIATIEDAKRRESVFGATGTANGQYQVPNIVNKLFGTKFKLIPGFKTTAEIYLAMERNEIDGIYGGYDVVAQVRPTWVAKHRFNWLAQLYVGRSAEFPNVPSLQELAHNDRERTAIQFLALARVPGKIFITPPGVPAERLDALRRAFAKMLKDPAFKADLAKGTLKLDSRPWQEAETIIRETVETDPATVSYVRKLLNATD
jgi:tripartite-type tricarboxylate transporter receptor subunit TctC